jgi:peptidoglycan/LPS O-acetylase OafA/YrhL
MSHFPKWSFYTTTLVVVLPATIAVSALSYHLIEKPFLELRVRYKIPKATKLAC